LKLDISVEARVELLAARDVYEGERSGLGQEFVDEIEEVIARVVAGPLQFPQVRRSRARRAFGTRFPYQIVFFAFPERIRVIAVAHQKQRPHYWRRRA